MGESEKLTALLGSAYLLKKVKFSLMREGG